MRAGARSVAGRDWGAPLRRAQQLNLRGHRKEAQARVRSACGKAVSGLALHQPPRCSAPVRFRRRAGLGHVARALASRARHAEGAWAAPAAGWRRVECSGGKTPTLRGVAWGGRCGAAHLLERAANSRLVS